MIEFNDSKISPGSESRSSTPDTRTAFKDRKEAIEAFKDLLKEKVADPFQVLFILLKRIALECAK